MKKTKIIYLKKRMQAAACKMFYVVNHPASTERQLPIYCVQKDYKVVSISFDAACGNVRAWQ